MSFLRHLVLAHWDQFLWHEIDLGCISDIPYDTQYVDESPCVCKSRRHNYAERNAIIIEAKSQPLIDLGVYRRAGPEVVDRAQLVVVLTKPDDPMNLKYCRVAHDFRCKNDKALLVPVPMATRPKLYSFLTRFQFFWKTDADRGFLQVVQAPSAIRHTGFELFYELYVSERMLFGQINGPALFELNFNVIARDLKFNQKVVKNFFEDILGGSNSLDDLLASWAQLLQQARRHSWKFKPAKTEFGFGTSWLLVRITVVRMVLLRLSINWWMPYVPCVTPVQLRKSALCLGYLINSVTGFRGMHCECKPSPS